MFLCILGVKSISVCEYKDEYVNAVRKYTVLESGSSRLSSRISGLNSHVWMDNFIVSGMKFLLLRGP